MGGGKVVPLCSMGCWWQWKKNELSLGGGLYHSVYNSVFMCSCQKKYFNLYEITYEAIIINKIHHKLKTRLISQIHGAVKLYYLSYSMYILIVKMDLYIFFNKVSYVHKF